jgi:hypothetical protein
MADEHDERERVSCGARETSLALYSSRHEPEGGPDSTRLAARGEPERPNSTRRGKPDQTSREFGSLVSHLCWKLPEGMN